MTRVTHAMGTGFNKAALTRSHAPRPASLPHHLRYRRVVSTGWSLVLAAIALLTVPGTAYATDTAVLIGVGKFINLTGSDLPGIGLDIDMMKGVANRLGYTAVVELRDEQGTRRAIMDQLERVLVTDASPNDRVLVFFSGHGTRIDVDEGNGHFVTHSAIVAADASFAANPDGSATVHGVLVGKEFADLFRRARVKSVTLVVDACHSGSIDKAVNLTYPVLGTTKAVRKFLVWPGMPAAHAAAIDKAVVIGLRKSGPEQARYVSMAAAGDEESALATTGGSMFTVGMTQAIASKSADGQITPRQTVRLASEFIQKEAAKASGEVFHPEVHGADQMIDAPMHLTDTSAGGGPNWREVLRITSGLPKLDVTGVQPQYKDGQEVRMQVKVPSEGYLNIVSVGPDDTVTLLYPNQNARDNHVQPGTLSLPADIPKINGQEIYYPIATPYGKTLIAAIVTHEPLDLVSSATDSHSGKALYTPSLAALKQLVEAGNATRSIAVATRKSTNISAWGVAIEAQTCGAGGC